jgi:hypothetical protein
MKIEVFEDDWVDTAKQKDVFSSIRGKIFDTKEGADRDSTICMFLVLYYLHLDSFTEGREFLEKSLDIMGYEDFGSLLDADLLSDKYTIQKRYAKATREDFDRVKKIMEDIG